MFDIIPKFGLLITVPGTIVVLIIGILAVIVGQWALGVILIATAIGFGFLAFKFWQLLQPAK